MSSINIEMPKQNNLKALSNDVHKNSLDKLISIYAKDRLKTIDANLTTECIVMGSVFS